MQRAFRAVPLSDLTSAAESISIVAETDLAALLQAREVLGDDVPFDLCEGERLVVVYRPTRAFGSVRLGPKG